MTLCEADARADPPDTTASSTLPSRRHDLIAVGLLVTFTIFLWAIRRNGPAQLMEEAFMLALPERVLHGAVPGRDVDYFYGPLSLWVPALAYKVFGATLVVERLVGAAYLALLGVALYLVGRRWSWWIGIGMGAIAVSIGALSISALPVTGAIAFLVLTLALALGPHPTARTAWAVGLSAAAASVLRPDFALWALVLLVVLTLVSRIGLLAWVAFAVGHVPYLVQVLRGGWHDTYRTIVTDGSKVSAERWLPWHVRFDGTNVLLALALMTIVAAITIGIVDRHAPDRRGIAVLGLGVIGLCLFPEFVQRADRVHTIYFLMVPFATMPAVVAQLALRRESRDRRSLRTEVVPLAVAALVLLMVQPRFVLRPTLRDAKHIVSGGVSYPARNDGRVWRYMSPEAAADHQRLVDAANRVGRPGDTLFVGTVDLARTSYLDGSFYVLLPRFRQRTHFYDFHPGVALDDGRRLATDVRDADLLVLCDVGFDERNRSRRRGSEEANRVVRDEFQLVDSAGGCRLYRRR